MSRSLGEPEVVDVLERIIDAGMKKGVDFIDIRYNLKEYELYYVENSVLKESTYRRTKGIGIRVLLGGSMGFTSTNKSSLEDLEKALDKAISIARAVNKVTSKIDLSKVPVVVDNVKSPYREDPFTIDKETKIELLMDANKQSLVSTEVKNRISRLAFERDYRVYLSSEGAKIVSEVVLSGFSHLSVARIGETMESHYDSKSKVAGYEFIESIDWNTFTREVSETAIKLAKARTPPSGRFTIVADPPLVGLLLHEAFGHASEADLVEADNSVLKNLLGKKVANERVNIVDEGVVENGYHVYYDDEGVKKGRTIIVENGVLKSYLHSRSTAKNMGGEPTGNSRAMDYSHIPIVRQTNLYMLPGDESLEELIRETKKGFFVSGRGSMGGEVHPGMGTFTFSAGPSYVIENGEIKELVRGVALSGLILEILNNVEGISKEFEIETSVFGGCGKHGQLARVGDGGPYIRVKNVNIGGR